MREKKILRLIVWISVVIIVVSTLSFIYFARNTINDWLIIFSGVFAVYSTTALISAFAIKYQEKRWLRIAAKSSLFLLPVLIGFIGWRVGDSDNISIIEVILLVVLTYLMLIHIYLYTKATALAGTIVLLCIMLLGMLLKRNHMFGAGYAMTVGCGLLSIGSLMFAIRCLFFSENQAYFRIVTFFGGIILSLSFLGSLFKLQHWPGAGPLLMTSLVLLILGTVFLLFTLHSSGIIEWSSAFRRIFIKILIPWAFIFFIYFSRFLIPDLYDLIWSPYAKRAESVTTIITGFGMKDYEIEKKNGLNTEE
ncbi:MAG: hypothetical protein V1903_09445 [Bacteroidota bacterium]